MPEYGFSQTPDLSASIRAMNSAANILPNIKSPFDPKQYKDAIIQSIKDFERDLDSNHEVALNLASFGQNVVLNVTAIGSQYPSMIHFYGEVNGQPAHLIQHVSQLNFLIISVPKADPAKPPRRIGFYVDPEEPSQSDLK